MSGSATEIIVELSGSSDADSSAATRPGQALPPRFRRLSHW